MCKIEMSLEEFKKKFMSNKSEWDFNKFKILCNKCNSEKVEFNGYLELEEGYYQDYSIIGAIIVKCHDCGNAFRFTPGNYDNMNIDGEKTIKTCFKCGHTVREINNIYDNGLCKNCADFITKEEGEEK